MFNQQDLLALTTTSMPFGRFKGRLIATLPEEYLLWFAKKGFPQGQLGRLLQIQLELHIHGLTELLTPLINPSQSFKSK